MLDLKYRKYFFFGVLLMISVLSYLPILQSYNPGVLKLPGQNEMLIRRLACLIMLCVSVTIMMEAMKIKHMWIRLLAGALLLFSPYVIEVLSVENGVIHYGFLYLLAVLTGCYGSWKIQRNFQTLLLSVGMTFLFYEGIGYGSLAVIIYLLIWISDDSEGIKAFLGISFCSFLLALVIHFGLKGSIQEVLTYFRWSLPDLGAYFFGDGLWNNSWRKRGYVNILFFVTVVIVAIRNMMKNRDWKPLLSIAAIIFLMGSGSEWAKLPDRNLCYVMALALTDKSIFNQNKWEKIQSVTVGAMGAFICYTLCLYCLIFQSVAQMQFLKVYEVTGCIAKEIEQMKKEESDKVVISGNYLNGNWPDMYPQELGGYILRGVNQGRFLISDNSVISNSQWQELLMRWHGIKYDTVDEETLNYIIQSTEYQQLQVFPREESSMYWEKDIIVIKMGY